MLPSSQQSPVRAEPLSFDYARRSGGQSHLHLAGRRLLVGHRGSRSGLQGLRLEVEGAGESGPARQGSA